MTKDIMVRFLSNSYQWNHDDDDDDEMERFLFFGLKIKQSFLVVIILFVQ